MRNYINIADYLEDRVAIYMFVSLRGTGKTYSATHLIYDDIMENGNEFIYLRRTKEELKVTKDNVFSGVEGGKIYCKGNKYFWKEETEGKDIIHRCGYAVALSTNTPLKSVNYDNVKYVLFDEFTITSVSKRYLPGEFDLFATIVDTIMRTRSDVKIIMLGNKWNFYNPYTIGWNVQMAPKQKKWTGRNGRVRYVDLDSERTKNIREGTVISDIFSGTSYDQWAGQDNFIENNNRNIRKKSKSATYYFGIDGQMEFSVWVDMYGMYVSDSPRQKGNVYTFDRRNLADGIMFFSRQRNEIQRLRHYFSSGRLFYESEKIKSQFVPCLNYIISF